MTASHSAVGQARDSVSFGVRISHAHPATWLLIILGIAFSLWFSAYGIRLHDAHLTHKADLGQIDHGDLEHRARPPAAGHQR